MKSEHFREKREREKEMRKEKGKIWQSHKSFFKTTCEKNLPSFLNS